jgi:hypothetical protein
MTSNTLATNPVIIQIPENTETIHATGLSLFQGPSTAELSWKMDTAGYRITFSGEKTGYTMVDMFNRPIPEIVPVPKEITLDFHFPNGARVLEPVTTYFRYVKGSVVQITACDCNDDENSQPTVVTLQFRPKASLNIGG